MCWTNNFKIAVCTADKDIPIFKICHYLDNTSLCSYYSYFEYELNKVYKLEEKLSLYYNDYMMQYEISKGFHSYDKSCSVNKKPSALTIVSYYRDLLDNYNPHCVKVRGYIPKGSHYYLNTIGEYVSDSICLTKIEKL